MTNPRSPTSRSPVIPLNSRSHRKRISALRLSSDTTSTLPEYVPTGGWPQTATITTASGTGRSGIEVPGSSQFVVDPPLDLPPDYSDSAEEADEDTDFEGDTTLDGSSYSRHRESRQPQQPEYIPQFTVYGPHHHGISRTSSGTESPKKFRRYLSHRTARSFGSTTSLRLPLPPPVHSESSHASPVPSPTTSDLFLDSLLERSVHALEMSNALLQSSMNTKSSISNLISAGAGPNFGHPPCSDVLAVAKRGSRSYSGATDEYYDALESRIKTWRNVRDTWAEDLDEINKGVERLYAGGDAGTSVDDTEVEVGRDSQSNKRRREHARDARRPDRSISSSMPTESPLKRRRFSSNRHLHERLVPSTSHSVASHRSVDEDESSSAPQLRFEQQQRERLIAHPPRALTQYVEANSDADTIVLPSTLGLRSTSSSHRVVTAERREIASKGAAYSMLSSLASRSACPVTSTSSSPTSTFTSPKKSLERSRSGSSNSHVVHTGQHIPFKRRKSTSPPRSSPWVGILGRSRPETPKPAVGKGHIANGPGPSRLLTPPIESLSSPSQSPSSSSDEEPIVGDQWKKRGPSAKRTVLELRRILDEQPSPQPEAKFEIILRPPTLLQKVGGTGTTAEAGTSNATASVSRLLTKNKHSSSTRPPSPPRQSALKGRSIPGTPTTPMTPPTSFAVEAAVHAAQATAKPTSDSPSGSGSAFRMPQVFTSFAKGTFLLKGKGKAKEENMNSSFLSPPTLSPAGSGASTPKRISFAELPESYSGGYGKRGSARRSKNRHGRKRSLSDSDEVEDGGWLGWLIGSSVSSSRHDRMEDRYDRPWGNGPGSARLMGGGVYSSGLDDWAV